jgi:hypothetical protein
MRKYHHEYIPISIGGINWIIFILSFTIGDKLNDNIQNSLFSYFLYIPFPITIIAIGIGILLMYKKNYFSENTLFLGLVLNIIYLIVYVTKALWIFSL